MGSKGTLGGGAVVLGFGGRVATLGGGAMALAFGGRVSTLGGGPKVTAFFWDLVTRSVEGVTGTGVGGETC